MGISPHKGLKCPKLGYDITAGRILTRILLLLSVLAIARPHRSGLYSTLAILEPRWCPGQIQVLSQKLTGGAPGRGRQVWRCPPKTPHFVAQNSLFWPETALKLSQNGQRRQTVRTLHMCLDCPVNKSPFSPSSSTICPRNGPKNGQKWPECALFVFYKPKTKQGPYLGLNGSKPNSEGTYSTRKPPLFVVSKPQNRPTRRLDPRTSGHLVQPEGSPARVQWGPTVGPPGSPGRKKSLLPNCSHTTWDAQAGVFSPF